MAQNLENVYSLLWMLLNPDPNVRNPAEQQINHFEATPNFSKTLLDIILNQSAGQPVRMMSIVLLKNMINKYWKNYRTRGYFLSDEEKHYLRERLLQLHEEDLQISIQIAVTVSIIARNDFPNDWPNLLPTLLEIIQNSTIILKKHRAMLILHHVVKALASKRIPTSIKQFQQASPTLFGFCQHLWSSTLNTLLSALSSFHTKEISQENLSSLAPQAEICKLCIKILRRLVVYGIPQFDQHSEVVQFLTNVFEKMNTLIQCALSVGENPLTGYVKKFIILKGKLITELQKTQPVSFGVFLKSSLEFYCNQLLNNAENLEEKFAVQCMIFMKNVIECSAYTEEKNRILHQVVTQFFNLDNTLTIIRFLVLKMFVLTKENLEEWEGDPENYFQEDQIESWEDKQKPCAENLFLIILEKNRDSIAQHVVKLLNDLLKETQQNSFNALLLKEACFHAIGLGSYDLYDHIPFENWFQSELIHEFQKNSPSDKYVKRRVLWMIGRWVDRTKDIRNVLYQIVLSHMSNEDVVVALTASQTLKDLVDDFEFNIQVFYPYLEPILRSLFHLLDTLVECDTKLKVLHVLSVLINQTAEKIIPHSSKIIDYLKMIWKNTEHNKDHSLLKPSILSATSNLVKVLVADDSNKIQEFNHFIIPVVKYSTDIRNPDSIYLIEDGLKLWLSALKQALSLNADWLSLFPNIAILLGQSFEEIHVSMKIIEQYLIVGQVEFLKLYVQDIVQIFQKCIGNLVDQGTLYVVRPMDLFVQLYPNEAPSCLESVLGKIIQAIMDNSETDIVTIHYISLFARILLQNPNAFFTLFQNFSQQMQRPQLLVDYIEIWLEKIDSMVEPQMRKLTALALCNLLCTKNMELLGYLGQILSTCISVRHTELNHNAEEYEEGTNPKRALLQQSNPVNQIQLTSFLMQKLEESRHVHGAPLFQQALQNVSPSILSQLPSIGIQL